jgi:hypothetical protein
MTITLDARGNQTLVGWRQIFDTAAHRERIAKFVQCRVAEMPLNERLEQP